MVFIGNRKARQQLGDWLMEHYQGVIITTCPKCFFPIISKSNDIECSNPRCKHNFKHPTAKKTAIIYGDSGNGKTCICEYFAEKMDLELFRFTPVDIENEKDYYNIVKSVNADTFSEKRKLVVIDDIDDFSAKYAKRLKKELVEISKYPVVFTCSEKPKYSEFTKQSILVRVMKPLVSEIVKHLRETLDVSLSDDELREIVQKSTSFRSAVLSAQSSMVNDLLIPYQTKYEILRDIKNRKLKEPLTRQNIWWIFNSIRGVDDNAYAVLRKFAEFDYLIRTKHIEIDSFVVNNLREPIDKITWKQHYRFRKNNNWGKKKKEPKVDKITPTAVLDKWL